jgi:O-antigen/teichoic acid export membrane protein
MTTADAAIANDAPRRSLLHGGALGGIIKLSSAGLAFLMFFSVALVTDAREFGLFGAAFAAASLVSFFSTVGQQSVALRFWPEHVARGEVGTAQAFMARSIRVAAIGTVAGGVLVFSAAFVPYGHPNIEEWMPTCMAASLLAMALSWSEFISAALRAKGSLLGALLPRDIIWRGTAIIAMLVLWLSGVTIHAPVALLICAIILIVATLSQGYRLVSQTFAARPRALSERELQSFRHVTTGLWGVTSLPPAMSQASTLLVAVILGPEIAGGVFVAERTARLVEVAQTGINQVLAPEISAAYHNGRLAHVQRVSALTALASGAVSVAALLVFIVMGRFVLGIFDPSYDSPTLWGVLLILGAGTTIGCACGPVGVLLQLTGAQHSLLRILLVGQAVGLTATLVLTFTAGAIGAAVGVALTGVLQCVAALVVARRDLGVDPSIMGLRLRPSTS